MTKTKTTGQARVGELQLTCLDVGFDLRLDDWTVMIPDRFGSAGIEEGGDTYLIEGSRAEMIAAIKAAGYKVLEELP